MWMTTNIHYVAWKVTTDNYKKLLLSYFNPNGITPSHSLKKSFKGLYEIVAITKEISLTFRRLMSTIVDIPHR